jgi:hypothetical protein
MDPRSPGFVQLMRAEAPNVVGLRHLLLIILLPTFLALMSAWFPSFPTPVYVFFNGVFNLEGWAEIVLLNVYTGLFFVLYWVGVFDATRIYVQPYEERHLIFSLSKPVRARSYMAARFLPITGVLVLAGAVTSAACLAAMSQVGLSYDAGAAAIASAVSIVLAILVLAVVNYLMLFARDTYTAIGIAFLPMFIFFLPAAMYVYRRDLFEDAPLAESLLVFPANVIWHGDILTWAAGPVLGFIVAIACLFVLLAGITLAHRSIG